MSGNYMTLSAEMEKILNHEGNTLVVANPGTGKTLLLAHKYLRLITSGAKSEEILCLTFTERARKEMEDRIMNVLTDNDIRFDISKLMIKTFHSYALEAISENNLIPPNFMRYQIFKYFKENDILTYSDDYLIDTIVPKMQTLILYLKSFGVTPEKIKINDLINDLTGYKEVSKEELNKFAIDFIKIYKYYESKKSVKGIDYPDMLIKFLALKNKVKHKYVLVDELQDINTLEAEIALKSGHNFFAVGDKKQAIFGFQGGSINNFEKFMGDAPPFILSDNFRSTNEILKFSKDYFIRNTKDTQHNLDLASFKNADGVTGVKPSVYEISADGRLAAICELIIRLKQEGKNIAIIARTNLQISRIAKELEKRKIKFSSTYFSESSQARHHVINFIRGILSNDPKDIRNSLFSPFAPVPLQDLMELTKMENSNLTLDLIYDTFPIYYEVRSAIKNVEDVNELFKTKMVPLSVAYGKDYLLSVLNMQQVFNEALNFLDDKSYGDILTYMKISEPMTDDSDNEGDIVLTTVHKAKGREFDYVIFAPQTTRDSSNFQDYTAKTILKANGIMADEEIDEENFRINFVAFTRAKEQLHIFPDKVPDFLSEHTEKKSISVNGLDPSDSLEKYRRAFNLFLNGDLAGSLKLLEEKEAWVEDFINQHFSSLEHLSFSALSSSADNYLEQRILKITEHSAAAELGTKVHETARSIFNNEEYEMLTEVIPYVKNIEKVLSEIEKTYPNRISAEYKISVPLDKLTGIGQGMLFNGSIDAIFRNDSNNEYLIVDWKTDKKSDRASEHRQQLETYRRAFAISENIPLEKIRVAIAFVGLQSTVNLGNIDFKLDDAQPSKSAFETVKTKIIRIIEWKNNPSSFLDELAPQYEYSIASAIKQQYVAERSYSAAKTSRE